MCIYKCNDHLGIHMFPFWLELCDAQCTEMWESWGWSYIREELFSCLHLNWGNRCKIIDMPWSWKWSKTEYKLAKGGFALDKQNWPLDKPDAYEQSFPYVYTLKSGEVQNRVAKVGVVRMTWVQPWVPWIKRVRTYIDVTFDQEVGERTGSWKGGCIGCSYDLRINETPYECLKRMESERKFE